MKVSLYRQEGKIIAGVDEAGRGPLAGPVFAAAVILPNDFEHELLDDSKKLSEKKRLELKQYIEQHALAWAVAYVDSQQIDKLNILNATIRAMHLALEKLSLIPDFIIVDGNRFKPYKSITHRTVIGGDGIFAQIAAASVLAKTYRDEFMIKIDREFPQYNWRKNKGYATKQHKEAVLKYGLSPYHRKSFCGFYFQRRLFKDKN